MEEFRDAFENMVWVFLMEDVAWTRAGQHANGWSPSRFSRADIDDRITNVHDLMRVKPEMPKTFENWFRVRLAVLNILTADNPTKYMADSPAIEKGKRTPRRSGDAKLETLTV